MKSEDHIHFLADLLDAINELQTLVGDYCREMTGEEEEEPSWVSEKNNGAKIPF